MHLNKILINKAKVKILH